MVIKASSSRAVDALVTDLSSSSAITRDAAVARLIVIGARAVRRVLAVASNSVSPAGARAAAFRALEAIGDPSAIEPAIAATSAPDSTVAIAALGVARTFLKAPEGVAALDRVTGIALDTTRERSVRLAAINALRDLDAATTAPIFKALEADSDPEIAGARSPRTRRKAAPPEQRLREAANGTLGDDPAALRRALSSSGSGLTPSALHQIVEGVRIREGSEPPSRRGEWMAVRAAAHGALAHRGSRLGLYDLRETIAGAKQPVAVEFVSAITHIGEASCLESIAAAYAHASAGGNVPDGWWRRHLEDAFRTIAAREGVTRRHAAARKIDKRWPGAFAALLGTARR